MLRLGRSILRRFPRFNPARVLLAAASIVVATAFTSCGPVQEDVRTRDIQEPPAVPIKWIIRKAPGVPNIRVLLTAQSVRHVELTTTGGYCLRVDGRKQFEARAPLSALKVTRQGPQWSFNGVLAGGNEVTLEPEGSSVVCVGATSYRGLVRLLPADEASFNVVNVLDLESYLAGVLAREMYPGWELEAYRALAVAARTFAVYQMQTFGTDHAWDLGANQNSQMYGGLSGETDKSRSAVRSTRGEVLTYGPSGNERLFLAQYSSCCGGVTNGAEVIRNVQPIAPLQGGQVCDDCRSSPKYRWPPVAVSKRELYSALAACYPSAAALGAVRTLQVASQTAYGRIVWVDVIGTTGQSLRVRAEDIRLALIRSGAPSARGLLSMNCEMRDIGSAIEFRNGRGFGHGVGLCQWGAQGKALRGMDSRAILACYYPQSRIYRLY